jgi:hypothetical protein
VDAIAVGPEKEDNLEKGNFVCMRRGSEISQESEFIPAPEVSKQDDVLFGTHRARDATTNILEIET